MVSVSKSIRSQMNFWLAAQTSGCCGSTAVRRHRHLLSSADWAPLEDVYRSMCVCVCLHAILSMPLHFSLLCWCKLRVQITQWTAVSGWYWIMSEWFVMSTCRKCRLSSCQDIEEGQQNKTLWECTLQKDWMFAFISEWQKPSPKENPFAFIAESTFSLSNAVARSLAFYDPRVTTTAWLPLSSQSRAPQPKQQQDNSWLKFSAKHSDVYVYSHSFCKIEICRKNPGNQSACQRQWDWGGKCTVCFIGYQAAILWVHKCKNRLKA